MAEAFAARKARGTSAEFTLLDLLATAGATVLPLQALHDAAGGTGAAVGFTASGTIHAPDLAVWWPRHPIPTFAVEVKFKHPTPDGLWAWDTAAFGRALTWGQIAQQTVLYAVRNPSHGPLPAPGTLDDPNHWRVASIAKLLLDRNRATSKGFHLWADAVFSPLPVLLDGAGGIATMDLPHYARQDGQPPRLL